MSDLSVTWYSDKIPDDLTAGRNRSSICLPVTT